ncbi:hypothetical protein ACQPZJ_14610 [Actinoplanes sp. CA-054009]
MDILLAIASVAVIVVLVVALVIGVRRGFDDGYRRGIGPTRRRNTGGNWLGGSARSSDETSVTGSGD